jgi:hypothetical protein
MEMVFLNASQSPKVIAEQQQGNYNNYYLARCPNGITTHSYNKLTYKNIYPNIDLVLSAKAAGMEYSFVVYPGGDVNDIKIQWNGVDSIRRLDGGIRYANELGYLWEGGLRSYAGNGEVNCTEKIQDNLVSFKVKGYDKSQVLVIDPTLAWSTYYGGSNGETSYGVSLDKQNNIFITGYTSSSSGIATTGAYQTSLNGNSDVFIAKFSSKDSLLWASYYGGNSNDLAYGISVDKKGNACITGYTNSSSGIATSGAHQTSIASSQDAFLAKFSGSGSLSWATYYGGSDYEYGNAIATDTASNIFITGITHSSSNIASSGAYQTSNGGLSDAYLAKFSPSGSMLWGTFFGGSGEEEGVAVATNDSGDVYLCGSAFSTTKIATSGAYETSNQGNEDAFLAKFSSSGNLIWSTYFGGPSEDRGQGMATDHSGNPVIVGYTESTSGIASSGAYQAGNNGGADAFIARFTSSGSFSWSTYLGGNSTDVGSSVSADALGNVLVAGYTYSTRGIASPGAYHKSKTGSPDAFFSIFHADGSMDWSTYFGGGSYNYGQGIVNDSIGNTYITGFTYSSSGIATSGAYKSTYSGNGDAFIAKFRYLKVDAGVTGFLSPKTNFCAGNYPVTVKLKNYGSTELDSVKILWSVNRKMQTTYSWTGQLQPDSTTSVKLADFNFTPGKDTLLAWTYNPNGLKDSVPYNDTATIVDTSNTAPNPNAGGNHIVCSGTLTVLGSKAIAGHTYSWTSKPSGFTSTSSSPTVSPDSTTVYYLTEKVPSTGCVRSDSALITVNPSPSAKLIPSRSICAGDSVILKTDTVTAGHTYSWTSKPSGFTSASGNPAVSPSATTKYYLTETITATGCSKTDSVTITVNPLPNPYKWPSNTICYGDSAVLSITPLSGHTYVWSSDSFSSAASSITVRPKTTTKYYLTETITATGCKLVTSGFVYVNPLPVPKPGKSHVICQGESAYIGDSMDNGKAYSWTSKPGGFSSSSAFAVVKPAVTTTYYLTVTSSTGCSKTDSVTITVNPLPAAKTGADQSICLGQDAVIGDTAVSGNSYSWTSKPVGFSSNKSNPSVSPVITTTYYLTETANNTGCSKSDSVTVTVNPLPMADAGKDTSVCEGGAVTIGPTTKPAGFTYSWTSDPAGFSSSSNSIIVSPSSTTTYILAERNNYGCSDTDSVKVTVYPLPQPDAGSDRSICAGDSISIGTKAVAGHAYHWTSQPAAFSANVATPVVKPISTTTYYLTEISEHGCSMTDSVTITVNPLPLAQTSGNKTICRGDKIAIGANAVAGNSYQWSSSPLGFTSNNSNPEVSPQATTTYYLTETNASGCSKADSLIVTVNPVPQKPFAGKDMKLCEGDTVTLRFVPAAGMKYGWTSIPVGFTSTDSSVRVHPSADIDYILTATNKTIGCSNADTVRVTVIPLPQPKIVGQKSFCGIDTATYITPGHDSSTYIWTISNGKILSGQATNSVKVSWLDTGSAVINVRETNANGCQKTDSIQVEVHPKPNAGFTPYVSCAGNPVRFSDSLKKGLFYTWDFGDGTILKDQLPIHAYAKAGKYRMKETVQNAAGCQDTLSWLITMYPVPDNVKLLVQHDTGRTYQFGVSDTTYMSYTWSFGDGDSSMEKFPVHTFTKSLPDKVKLIVDNSFHCIAEIDTTFEVSYLADKDSINIFPNPFSNQIHIYERLKENTNLKLYVYDILGQKILENASWSREPGIYTESFDEYGLAQAMYVIKLVVNDKEVIYKKMIKLGR